MNFTKNKYFKFFGLYCVIILVNYFTPGIVRVIFFSSLLIVFYKSKQNAFWIALFFVIQYAPGYLFNNIDAIYNLNFYRVPGSDRNISFNELSIVIMFLKALTSKEHYKINKIFLLLIFYSIFLFAISFAFGVTTTKILRTIRFLIPYTLFWSLPVLLLKEEKFLDIFNYFLIFSIVVFAMQIYMFVSGKHFFTLLGGRFEQRFDVANDLIFDSEHDLVRPLYSTHILFLNIIIGLYYFISNSNQKPKYLIVYVALSLISLIITGTRGYSIGAIAMIFIYFIILPKRLKTISKYLMFFLIGLFVILLIPQVNKQMSLAIDRIMTVTKFAEGDITAGGTSQRFNRYMPMVMNKFTESPIIGFGFSDDFYANTNAHVAIPNTLLNGGIVGLILFLAFLFYFYFRSTYWYLHIDQKYIIIVIGLTGFLIVHIFSFAIFSYLLGQANYFCFVLFLVFADILYRQKVSVINDQISNY